MINMLTNESLEVPGLLIRHQMETKSKMSDIKIICSGQSGADLSGIRFAKKYGIDKEINCFYGFKPERGELPIDVTINYVCNRKNYNENLRCRTLYNVKNSDVTIVLLNKKLESTRGSKLTVRYCNEYKKPVVCINMYDHSGFIDNQTSGGYLRFSDVDDVKIYLRNFKVINIAGQMNLDELKCVEVLEKLLLE